MAFDLGPEELSAEDHRLLRIIAAEIARRKMAAPAIFALETLKPLSFIGSQAMVVLGPTITNLIRPELYNRVQLLLEKRVAVEQLILYLEEFQAHPERMEEVEGGLMVGGEMDQGGRGD